MKEYNVQQLDQILIKLYKEYQERKGSPRKCNLEEYFHNQSNYIQNRLHQIIYFDKD
ncbi:hypothetical protein HOD61_00980 [archaeon]|jgi:hypothetical protein|nr:hypothetical protein [archaeon]